MSEFIPRCFFGGGEDLFINEPLKPKPHLLQIFVSSAVVHLSLDL